MSKTDNETFLALETAESSKPVELFHLWRDDGSEHWRYTSGDADFNSRGYIFTAATMKRGPIEYDSKLEVSTLTISGKFNFSDPLFQFLSLNPVETIWVEVSRSHRAAPDLPVIIFIGQVKAVGLVGSEISVQCVGFEFWLKLKIPTMRYSPKCNFFIFDDIRDGRGCGVDRDDYKLTTTITIDPFDPVRMTLFSDDFAGYDDGYFNFGWLVFGDHKRMITYHGGNTVKIRYPIASLTDSQSVDVYPGCDGSIETCFSKFNNVVQFGGHPYIPIDNPVTRY